MRYMRMSMDAQSQLSVPPAPEVICITALRPSSSALNMFLNSSSSMDSLAAAKALSTSDSSSSPAFMNSYKTDRSSTAVAQSSYDWTQPFLVRMRFMTFSASLGSFQNSGSCVSFSSSAISMRFCSTPR